MIIEEDEKKEGKDEKLLVDLCECYIFLSCKFTHELLSICVPCILKVALRKEGNEESQREVDFALLALSNIKFHQEHHNLTLLAYQSAWEFLINRLLRDKSLEEVIVNELQFPRAATRVLDDMVRFVDWKKEKEEEKEERRKDKHKELIILRWLRTLERYFHNCTTWKEGNVELINSLVQLFRAAKYNHRKIGYKCIDILLITLKHGAAGVDGLLKGGAIDAAMEEILQQTLNHSSMWNCLRFFEVILEKLKEEEDDEKGEKEDDESEKMKRKEVKRKVFEKMEEEGYEDCTLSFQNIFDLLFMQMAYDLIDVHHHNILELMMR
eukprot:MONOS_4192.1-p1 / transcript=MONOS_4192.1 / gene=MONOS_4192 / organism=Monocercomonoides_exilis_PA203 / gene_product=unspecified product / transcript_product=unspecified product / location=Mono_scaffold00108:32884-33974(+) / protein_length=324 / sequence_SO=supercontig / SO=protein_coding / is_pseudo=false